MIVAEGLKMSRVGKSARGYQEGAPIVGVEF